MAFQLVYISFPAKCGSQCLIATHAFHCVIVEPSEEVEVIAFRLSIVAYGIQSAEGALLQGFQKAMSQIGY